MERDNKAVSTKRPWGCGLPAIHQMPRINYTASTGDCTTRHKEKKKKERKNQVESGGKPKYSWIHWF